MPYNPKSFLLYFFSSILLLFSCQKDVSIDYGPASGGTSIFTYDGAPSSCGTVIVNGNYSKAVALTAANTVDVTVNVTKIGTYNVSTTTGNGVYFKGNGSFGATGVQTITLTGYGTPTAEGSYIFVPRGNGCNFSVGFTTGGSGGGGGTTAVFTYAGAPGNCTGATPTGSYFNGVAMSTSNFVDLSVNVTTLGAYNITTNTSKGISFAKAGAFTTLGVQTVRLAAQGTPNAIGAATLTPTGGCSFSVTIAAAPVAGVFTYNCTVTPRVAGTYTAGTPLNATNTVTIDVNVSTAGGYAVTTSAANGVTFGGAGVFATTGTQTIVLTGIGNTLLSGQFPYTPSGVGGCAFNVTYGAAPTNAVGTLTCASIVANGTYTQGVTLNASNTITIPVNVTTAGVYTITASGNSCTFTSSGNLAAGNQVITLNGAGTPSNSGPVNYSVTLGASSCTFPITFLVGANPANYFRCKIGGVLKTYQDRLVGDPTPIFGINTIAVSGYLAPNPSDDYLDITINSLNPITVGTYPQGFGLVFSTSYNRDNGFGWQPSSSSNPAFAVIVTAITATRITGTFSGQYIDLNGTGTNTKQVTEGAFSVNY